jgi:2-polyprenyl-3-methyl-5-hydroxy-6-metoxy-1,4-benzoquinol methylase
MSINYYNTNAQKFINDTFNLAMSDLMDEFLAFVPDEGIILDLGCGSGRDSVEFQRRGYVVVAVDGSQAMIEHAAKFLGNHSVCSTFAEYETDIRFHGIWALASLLHVPEEDMAQVIRKYLGLLVDKGIFLISFKNRDINYEKDGRIFTCYTKDKLASLLSEVGSLDVIKFFETVDRREDRQDEKWISVIIKKSARDMTKR